MKLAPLECELVFYLGQRPGLTVPRDELLQAVWGYAAGVKSRAVDHTVRRLRQKIDPTEGESVVQSVYGGGYRMDTVLDTTDAPAPERQVDPSGLLGRSVLLAELSLYLQRPGLVTLHGPGGVGKSRLAHELGRSGSLWVDASVARAPGQLLAAVALVLGIGADGELEQTVARIAHALGHLNQLLIVDNCEQLTEDCRPLFERWAAAAPVLATSRTPLRAAGERLVSVPPLPVADGLQLLERSARRVQPGVDLHSDSIWREVVEAVDGLPLALLLLAPRVGMLPPARLLERLQGSLRLVGRSGAARHSGLEACIEWSWSLLEPDIQRSLAYLTVIPTGFDLDQAEAVVGEELAMDAIDALLDASMLYRTESGRMALFESVRVYAAARLGEAERQVAEARRRKWLLDQLPQERGWLLDHYVDIELGVWRGLDVAPLESARLAHALYRVSAALPMDRAQSALEAAIRALPQDHPSSAVLRLDLAELLRIRSGTAEELEAEVQRVLQLPDVEPLVRVRGLRILGALDRHRGDLAASRDKLVEADGLAARCGLHEARSLVQDHLGFGFMQSGDLENARKHHVEALAQARLAGSKAAEGRVLGNLGKVLRSLGELEEAALCLQRGLDCIDPRFRLDQAIIGNNLANVYLMMGRYAAARDILVRSAEDLAATAANRKWAVCLLSLAQVEMNLGHLSEGESRAGQALRLLESSEDRHALGWAWLLFALPCLARRDLPQARERLEQGREPLERAKVRSFLKTLDDLVHLCAVGAGEASPGDRAVDPALDVLARALAGEAPTQAERDAVDAHALARPMRALLPQV